MADPSETDLATLVGRARLPVEISGASGMTRLDWILELPEPAEFVQSLAVEELYLLMKDIGLHDSHALLEFASTEQMGSLLDLDIWHKHDLVLDRWVGWLDLALAVDLDTGLRLIEATDDETIELLFVRELAFHTKDIDPDQVPDELALIESPCGTYWVTYPHEHPLADRVPHLLKLLWAQDLHRMLDIAHTSRFELASTLEETLLHFHRGRLEELGFPAADDAVEAFRFVPPKQLRVRLEAGLTARGSVAPRPMGAIAGDLALRGTPAPRVLRAALAELSDGDRARFGASFTMLVNQVYMARTSDLSQTDELPSAARMAASLTNLGLSWLSDQSLEAASRLLRDAWPRDIFQVGFSLTFELALRARRVRRRAGAAEGLCLFGSPTDEVLLAVSQPEPMYCQALEADRPPLWRPFETLEELAATASRVDQADGVLGFFEARLGFSVEGLLGAPLRGVSEDARRQIGLEMLLATGLAQVLLRDELSYRPLDASDLVLFHKLAFERGAPTERWARATAALVAPAPEPIRAWLERAVRDLNQELGPVAAENLIPSYACELMLVDPATVQPRKRQR
jgi:hypothetical protein